MPSPVCCHVSREAPGCRRRIIQFRSGYRAVRAEASGDAKHKGATAKYLNYLKSGSSKHPVELLKDAGVDMTTPAPIESLIAYFSSLVDELDALTK